MGGCKVCSSWLLMYVVYLNTTQSATDVIADWIKPRDPGRKVNECFVTLVFVNSLPFERERGGG